MSSGYTNLPTKPQRPLSAYNLFFRLERERMLSAYNGGARSNDTSGSKSFSEESKISADDVAQISGQKRYGVVRRQDRKKHGKIGFAELAKTIAKKWKKISHSEKKLLEERAEEEKRKYKKLTKEYAKNLREYGRQIGNDASIPVELSPEEKEIAASATPAISNRHASYADGIEASSDQHYKRKNQRQREQVVALFDRQQQLMGTIQKQQQMQVRQDQHWNHYSYMMQQQQLSTNEENEDTWYPHYGGNAFNRVDMFSMMMDDASIMDSNGMNTMHQQAPFQNHKTCTIQSPVPFRPHNVQCDQSQPVLAFEEEENDDEMHRDGWTSNGPTNYNDCATFSGHGYYESEGGNCWGAKLLERETNANMMSGNVPLPTSTGFQSTEGLDNVENVAFQVASNSIDSYNNDANGAFQQHK